MKITTTLITSLVLVFSLPVLAESVQVVENKQLVILEVFDAPVGFRSEFKSNRCKVWTNIIPMEEIRIDSGNSTEIKVVNDEDIIIKCNEDKTISIYRK